MLPKAIFFDLDDTIISFDGVSEAAWKEICYSFTSSTNCMFDGHELLESVNKIRMWYWGDPERHRIGRLDIIKARREIVKKALYNLNCFHEEAAVQIADNYSKLQHQMICLFPDSINTLEKLKNRGVRMALITNGSKKEQREKINRFCLAKYFEMLFIEEEVGFGKPDIQVFNLALDKMQLRAEDVWMVGDNLIWDIEAPQKVGIYSIWNDYERKGIPEDSKVIPDRIIHSISELVE